MELASLFHHDYRKIHAVLDFSETDIAKLHVYEDKENVVQPRGTAAESVTMLMLHPGGALFAPIIVPLYLLSLSRLPLRYWAARTRAPRNTTKL
ncbi:hypothetical protein OE88DRAFT_49499 [Heliocybe sulcata]|uniref:Uncharacterized protein n=1 Tax=Heliocybe sulcata TaxID=5364 RepID=A0A5C3NG35_9AGAM|nr:hypothetical protein OE88DRAFT_49499 [Heliocybe sulcata]